MEITISSLRCSLQIALLGAVTPNLRVVEFLSENNAILLKFYYESSPTKIEEEISEIVTQKITLDFPGISVTYKRIVLPITQLVPQDGLRVYRRKEKLSIPENE